MAIGKVEIPIEETRPLYVAITKISTSVVLKKAFRIVKFLQGKCSNTDVLDFIKQKILTENTLEKVPLITLSYFYYSSINDKISPSPMKIMRV